MPIGNAYLSAYHLAHVMYPDQMVSHTGSTYYVEKPNTLADGGAYLATPPILTGMDVAYSRYEVRSEANVSPSELVQAWPGAKFFEVGAVTHVHEIDLPVLLVPSLTSDFSYKIRINEIGFWLSWLVFMFSTFDRATWANPDTTLTGAYSAVVERAGIKASTDGLKLSLSIRTNAPMGWKLNLNTTADNLMPGVKILGRPATNYDTFVKYEDYLQGDHPELYSGVGLNDAWGVNDLSMDASTSLETIVHTPYTDIDGVDTGQWLIADQINAKMVNFSGSLDAFGIVSGKTLGTANLSTQPADSSPGPGYTTGTTTVSPYDDPFPASKSTAGGIQVYVGSGKQGLGVSGQAMFLLPTGTLIGRGGIRAAGGTISITRNWSGTITNTPKNGLGGLRARTEAV